MQQITDIEDIKSSVINKIQKSFWEKKDKEFLKLVLESLSLDFLNKKKIFETDLTVFQIDEIKKVLEEERKTFALLFEKWEGDKEIRALSYSVEKDINHFDLYY